MIGVGLRIVFEEFEFELFGELIKIFGDIEVFEMVEYFFDQSLASKLNFDRRDQFQVQRQKSFIFQVQLTETQQSQLVFEQLNFRGINEVEQLRTVRKHEEQEEVAFSDHIALYTKRYKRIGFFRQEVILVEQDTSQVVLKFIFKGCLVLAKVLLSGLDHEDQEDIAEFGGTGVEKVETD